MPHSLDEIEILISQGRFLEAGTHAKNPVMADNLRAKQLYALALSKSGAPESARDFLEPVYHQNPEDPETAGILGSIYKELFKKNQQSAFAVQSRDTYLKNFIATNSSYTGINAAAMSARLMQSSKAKELSRTVVEVINPATTDFWELATLGEANLLIKERDKSMAYYVAARNQATTDWGKVTSVYNQLWLLNHYLPVSKELLHIFAPPTVVAFTGHMIDAPQRATLRFPESISPQVKDAIGSAIQTLHASIGYCSLACGADILFAEAMLEAGGEVIALIPFDREDFIDTSVRFAGEDWIKRYYDLITRVQVSMMTTELYGGNDDMFSLLGKSIFGSSVLRSQTYHLEPQLITVLSDVDLNRKEGGTRDMIKNWPYPQRHVNINPVMFHNSMVSDSKSSATFQTTEDNQRDVIHDRPVLFLAHINLDGSSGMEKEHIEKIIRTMAEEQQFNFNILQRTEHVILIAHASEMALLDVVRAIWTSTAPFKPIKPLRVSLHVAPVFVNTPDTDPNIQQLEMISTYTSEGSLCATQTFASVLALHPKKINLNYSGVVQLSESEEPCGLYRVNLV